MRIIAGECRGQKLHTPKGLHTRPTADRVKEAVFSTLQARLLDAKVLDLFAGSGAIGLEALSRGAKCAYFVEQNRVALAALEKNLEKTGFGHKSKLFKGDSRQFLKQLSDDILFDIIYVDPPYAGGLHGEILNLIAEYGIVAENGVIVLESAKNAFLSINDHVFLNYKSKTYGDSRITYITKRRHDPGGI